MNLITMSDIYAITGMDDEVLASLIDYAESQAEYLLGFLKEETKTEEVYFWDSNDVIKLEQHPITSITSVKTKATASATEETLDADTYRAILKDGLIIFDAAVPEDYVVKVEYKIGWTQTTVPNLVKVLLSTLVIQHYFSLYPEVNSTSQTIVSKKIGDVTLKYANIDVKSTRSLTGWVEYLSELIKSGSSLPDVF